jgi:hypothetical protein
MKKTLIAIALIVTLGSVAYVAADAAAAPEKGMVVGTAIEISTYATQGMTENDIAAMVARCEQASRSASSMKPPAKSGSPSSATTPRPPRSKRATRS